MTDPAYIRLPIPNTDFAYCNRCGTVILETAINLHNDWHVKLNRALATAGMFGTIGMGEV